MENISNFETLLKSKNLIYEARWHPYSIDTFEAFLTNGVLKNSDVGIVKNICYSMQYLQYISLQKDELKLHSIIEIMLIKNYIIIGISIIEAIFYSLIKINKLETLENKKLLHTVCSNKNKFEEKEIIVETNIYEKVPSYSVEMTLDSMIKKLEKKNILNLKHSVFPYIKKYKKLRNKVHLQSALRKNDSDWWSFKDEDYFLIRHILYLILTDKTIARKTKINNISIDELYNFLILTDEEKEKLKMYLKRIN